MVLQSDAEAALELWLASPAYQSRPVARTGRNSRALLPKWARSDAASQLPLLTPPSTAVPLGAASPMPPYTAQVHKQDIGGLSAVQGCWGRAVGPCARACGPYNEHAAAFMVICLFGRTKQYKKRPRSRSLFRAQERVWGGAYGCIPPQLMIPGPEPP